MGWPYRAAMAVMIGVLLSTCIDCQRIRRVTQAHKVQACYCACSILVVWLSKVESTPCNVDLLQCTADHGRL